MSIFRIVLPARAGSTFLEKQWKKLTDNEKCSRKTLYGKCDRYMNRLGTAERRKCWFFIGFTITFYDVKRATGTPRPRTTEREIASGRGQGEDKPSHPPPTTSQTLFSLGCSQSWRPRDPLALLKGHCKTFEKWTYSLFGPTKPLHILITLAIKLFRLHFSLSGNVCSRFF